MGIRSVFSSRVSNSGRDEEHTSSRNLGRILTVRLEARGRSRGETFVFFRRGGHTCSHRGADRRRNECAGGRRSLLRSGRETPSRSSGPRHSSRADPLRRRSLSARAGDARTNERSDSQPAPRAPAHGDHRGGEHPHRPRQRGCRRHPTTARGPSRRPVSADAPRRRPGVVSVTRRQAKGAPVAEPIG